MLAYVQFAYRVFYLPIFRIIEGGGGGNSPPPSPCGTKKSMVMRWLNLERQRQRKAKISYAASDNRASLDIIKYLYVKKNKK